MDFSGINRITTQSDFLPTKKLTDLTVEGDYIITDIRLLKTRYGDRYVADIKGEFTVFLPARVVHAFEENSALFEELLKTARAGQLAMKYLGGKLNGIEFHNV